MTAHDPHPPAITPPHPAAAADDSRDNTGVTVPVIVWRTTPEDPDATSDTTGHHTGLSARLARHLVAIYTQLRDTIVDFDADDNLRDAAEEAGRTYLAVTSPDELTKLSEHPRPVTLIVLRWRSPLAVTPAEAQHLLSACHRSLAPDGSAIVAVTAAAAGQPGTTHAEHEQLLIPAAYAAGLRHLHDIIPLTATDGRDTFTYHATAHNIATASGDTNADTPRQTINTTLVIFAKTARRP